MKKSCIIRVILGVIVLILVILGGLVSRQFRTAISLSFKRISSGGKIIEKACGPIQYSEFGEDAPMLIVHGAVGGYDQGEYSASNPKDLVIWAKALYEGKAMDSDYLDALLNPAAIDGGNQDVWGLASV
jgi:hypothetical protein